MPKVLQKKVKPEVAQSKTLSLFARPGDGSIRTRRVAIMVADGLVGAEVEALAERLASEGAVPVTIGSRLGRVKSDRGKPVEIGAPIDAAPSVVFDALVLPDGAAAAAALAKNGRVLEFLKDTYRHCKPILVLGASAQVLKAAGVPATLPNGKPDPGIIVGKGRRRNRSVHQSDRQAPPLRAGNGSAAGVIRLKPDTTRFIPVVSAFRFPVWCPPLGG